MATTTHEKDATDWYYDHAVKDLEKRLEGLCSRQLPRLRERATVMWLDWQSIHVGRIQAIQEMIAILEVSVDDAQTTWTVLETGKQNGSGQSHFSLIHAQCEMTIAL
jgi:adenylate cyclase class IV